MKKILLLMLSLVIVTMVKAEGVTPQQALEKARNFMQKREATGSRKVHRAPGVTTPQLTMTTSTVSGLYVINIAEGGFVVVSNDDRTQPILGFSDSGSIDPDNMPDNMRAWLQGYADEIAWIEQNGTTTITVSVNGSRPRRVGNHSTTAIEPMVKTTWNQRKPYNDYCPEYSQGQRAVTGCVATAMAQVMKYHEWPTAATTTIPGYTTATYGLSLSSLSATTFDWANMKDSYRNNNWTSTEANAVAKLMQYCGWSVKMDYGPESGSNSSKVADALKNYFDYKNSTVQVVSRTFYTAAKWADLIYHELANGRPVVYGGQSSGGGHEFVCDGYKCENGIDLFHINWGWGGMSDDYFVLSALDPNEQGIGGSTSTDGFNYGQEAVIGIQKSTDNGSVANITPNVINLTLNNMTLSKDEVTVNTEVTITMNITNNADDFEGSLYFGRKNSNSYTLLEGNYFTIPAGQTVNCVIPFTPTEKGTYEFVFFWPHDPNNISSYTTDGKVRATLNVVEYLKPYNIAVTPKTTSANVSWTGNENATSYNVRYSSLPEGTPSTLQYDNGSSKGNLGIGRAFYWAVKFPGGTYAGKKLTKVSNYDAVAMQSTVSIYNGDATTSGNLVGTKNIDFTGAKKFVDFKFDTPLDIDNTKDLWIVFYCGLTTSAVAACEDTTPNDANNSWFSVNGTQWYDLGNSGAPGYGWMIRGYMDTYDESDISWTTVSCNNEACLLTNLIPETNYSVQAQSVYSGGISEWSESASFTTLPPIELGNDATTNSETIAAHNGENTWVTLTDRTLYKDGAWNTLCLPFDVTIAGSILDGAVAKTLADATMNGRSVALTFSEGVKELKAGVPYIIKWESGEDIVNPTFKDVIIKNGTGDDLIITKADGHVKFVAYYNAFNINENDTGIYYMTADNKLMHTAKARTLKALRAYFQFTENITSNASQFILDFGDSTTSIGGLQSADDSNEWHTVDGMKLNGKPTKKGLYIRNGKKLVIK